MTSVTYLGHACFLFETENAACLIDPWLSPKGAFLGSWRQLPPNDHCLQWVLDKMKQKPVIVYVTHEHEDHYDEETLLQLLPHSSGLYIPRYENSFLQKLIVKNLRVQPHLVEENEPQQFHDITFKIFIDESGINRDSAIFLKSDDLSFFDGNDCKIFDRAAWLVEQCGKIDIMSSQFSGANMHPICYEMSPDDYKQTSRQKKLRKFVATRNYINDLKPKFFIPSAGPAIFPYSEHYHLNFESESIFPKWWEFQSYLNDKGDDVSFIPLNPMGFITTEGAAGFRSENHAEVLDEERLNEVIKYYRAIDAQQPELATLAVIEVLAYFEREMNSKIEVLKNNPGVKLGCPLYFEIKHSEGASAVYCIHPDRLKLEKVDLSSITAPYYLHTTSVAALNKLIQSGKGWGTYFLSFLFRSKRDPDMFDSALGTFFVANDADELDYGLKKLAQFRTSTEYVTLTSSDGHSAVTCKRFCPHQGADLKYARFDGRFVVCPRHQWRFDCDNGGKADKSGDTIDAIITKKIAV